MEGFVEWIDLDHLCKCMEKEGEKYIPAHVVQ